MPGAEPYRLISSDYSNNLFSLTTKTHFLNSVHPDKDVLYAKTPCKLSQKLKLRDEWILLI